MAKLYFNYSTMNAGKTTVLLQAAHNYSERGMNPPSQWQQYYRNVANHLTHGDRLIITAEWARRPIHIIDLAGQSAQRGKSLKVKYM